MNVIFSIFIPYIYLSNYGAGIDDSTVALKQQPEPIELAINYFNEDKCWTHNAKKCQVHGSKISIKAPLETFYLSSSLGGFASTNFIGDEGDDPYLTAITTTFSIGKNFELDNYSEINLESSWVIHTEDSNGNKNFNEGPELKSEFIFSINNDYKLGASLALQNFENCSNPNCHGLKSNKPRILNLDGELFFLKKMSEQWFLKTGASQILDVEDESLTNDRLPDDPSYYLEIAYLLKRKPD